MDRILVEVYVPALGRTFDAYIPAASKLREVESLLAGALSELSDGAFVPAPDTSLCERKSGSALDINRSAVELGLMNGTRLMLI
ncbi:methyltransferase [Cohnella sp. GCM10027633]|uniref:methyltransferase n=1 Tax=unclassified Cohnella TaxID=2636738 RepID=UPI00363DBED8